ncbi:MAG: superoxide dismutase [Pseudorhodoplanes sp.]|nr:superoxide dismutase [Pseudorhodoplanes sp.]MCQ3943828.1 superoxide dismutase [Alphaproteobacteria bacterium]
MLLIDRRTFVSGAVVLAANAKVPRAFAQAPSGPFTLDPLPYAANKNEPHIDAQTMEIHHGRHHAAYVNNLNAAASQHSAIANMPLHQLLGKIADLPENARTAVRNNGGGHANHTMFWQIMGGAGGEPSDDLKAAIDRDLGGFAKFQENFNAAGTRVFGSGWVFVTVTRDGALALVTRPNQDTPLMEGKRVLMGNDVWEHAYYLKYQNRRAEYLKAWWNVLDWDKIAGRYAAAKAETLTI